ncbi:serine/threonine protein kinase [Magnaporthiopsis poae ATCC 64411]|uniref:Serine/threonine protein kinase n=1 Tax=Magnaporthiopsis poae (strain ATCC 64411 / 73-15) TaxID=644358 RepID=A0A0C4E7Q7_MAGP6|nr:serine/threonine protein kinase [Magnaporthiopsis poae ATCC 64411]
MDPPTNTVPRSPQPAPVSSTVTEQSLKALREEKGAAVGAAAPGSREPSASTEATNPAPSSEIDRRWQEVRQKGKDANLTILSQGPHGSTEATNPVPSSEIARRWQEVRRKGKDDTGSTEATNPAPSSEVAKRRQGLRQRDKGITPDIPSRGPDGSTEATNPAPSSEIGRRRQEVRQKGKDATPTIPSEVDEPACEDTFPITQLATDHLTCRILMVEEQGTLKVPGAERIQVRRQVDSKGSEKEDKGNGTEEKGNKGKGKGKERQEKGNEKNEEGHGENGPFAECLAITQPQDDICCRVESPVRFELYYDPKGDSVWAAGMEPVIRIEPISPGDEGRQPDKTETKTIEQFDYLRVGPGAWRFSSADGLRSVQAIIFPRQHSFALVKLKTLSDIAGTKREAPPDDQAAESDTRQDAGELEPVATSEVIKRLDSLAELAEGQMLQVMNSAAAGKEYSLFRMALLGKTGSAQVFQARHSGFPNRLVVVKTFMYGDRYNTVGRGKLWKKEYSIHRGLKSDFIVELFAGDARLEALIMDNVDAHDLSSRHWCDVKGNKHFLGTRAHAVRVLTDMSQALLHLRQKGVLHNDIKPANILFSERRGAVLIDFGLATVDGSLATTGGTPWYVPREYLEKDRRAAPADVWALGVVIVYLLGLVPLPDSERQVKSWRIRDIMLFSGGDRLLPSRAEGMMTEWLGLIEGIGREMELSEDDLVANLVASMLVKEEERITTEDLASAMSSLAATGMDI